MKRTYFGFTLSELLIALAILGVIATFTIPKVLQSQQDSRFNATAKESMAAVAEAVQNMRASGNLTANTRFQDLTPYLNYVKVMTSGELIDALYGVGGTRSCGSGGWNCLLLHNGAVLQYHPSQYFAGTGTTNAMYFYFDPDGKSVDSSGTGVGETMSFTIYYDGKIRSSKTDEPNLVIGWWGSSSTSGGPCANCDPPWFSWN